MSKLEKIKKAIVEKVPDIMELKFGCRVKLIGGSSFTPHCRTITAFVKGDGKSETEYYLDNTCSIVKKDILENFGRVIRLSDVLLTLQKTYCSHGSVLESDWVSLVCKWNMEHDDIDEQLPSTISLLFNLLFKI